MVFKSQTKHSLITWGTNGELVKLMVRMNVYVVFIPIVPRQAQVQILVGSFHVDGNVEHFCIHASIQSII